MTNDEMGIQGWNVSAQDSSKVRHYSYGTWSEPMNSVAVQLNILDDIGKELERIRFRLGLIVFVIILPIVVGVLIWGAVSLFML